MKHLIIFAHPNTRSLCHKFRDDIMYSIKKNKQDVKCIDLYKENFQPVLNAKDFIAMNQKMYLKDVQKQQDLIMESKNITFIFPLWWLNFPAILKGYIDRVFTYDFAYKVDDDGNPTGLLNGIKINIVLTMGSKLDDYKKNGLWTSLEKSLELGIFSFCGATTNKWFIFDDALKKTFKEIEKFSQELRTTYGSKHAF